METKISADALQDLLRFALVTQRLAEFDADKVKREIQKAGPRIAIADAGTTVIKIHAGGKKHEASFYALGMMASQHPKIKALRQLEDVRKRIEQLVSKKCGRSRRSVGRTAPNRRALLVVHSNQ